MSVFDADVFLSELTKKNLLFTTSLLSNSLYDNKCLQNLFDLRADRFQYVNSEFTIYKNYRTNNRIGYGITYSASSYLKSTEADFETTKCKGFLTFNQKDNLARTGIASQTQ